MARWLSKRGKGRAALRMLIIKLYYFMTKKLYDEEGNPVEALLPEEVEAKVKEAVSPLEEKLKGFENKDYNFKVLRDKVLKGEELTTKEKEVYEREKALEEKEKSFQDRVVGSWKDKALNAYTDGDKELSEKVKFVYDNELSAVPAVTEEEISQKVRKAYILATERAPKANPLHSVMSAVGSAPPEKEKSYADTEEGKNLANLMGLDIGSKK